MATMRKSLPMPNGITESKFSKAEGAVYEEGESTLRRTPITAKLSVKVCFGKVTSQPVEEFFTNDQVDTMIHQLVALLPEDRRGEVISWLAFTYHWRGPEVEPCGLHGTLNCSKCDAAGVCRKCSDHYGDNHPCDEGKPVASPHRRQS